jgi:hypothetical protein
MGDLELSQQQLPSGSLFGSSIEIEDSKVKEKSIAL